jgi:hypothetical protein
MRGDIAIAGFMITAEEWESLDTLARAQLVAVITRRKDSAWVVARASDGTSEIGGTSGFGFNPRVRLR